MNGLVLVAGGGILVGVGLEGEWVGLSGLLGFESRDRAWGGLRLPCFAEAC